MKIMVNETIAPLRPKENNSMKYLTIALILLSGFLSIELTQKQHELNHLEKIQTETVKQCGEAWLELENVETQLHIDKESVQN